MLQRLLCCGRLPRVLARRGAARRPLRSLRRAQVRIDLRDLGYPPVDVIPSDESAIRALAVAPDGTLYGATSGKRSHLFVLSPQHGYVEPLGFLPGSHGSPSLVVVSPNGDVYIGTCPTGSCCATRQGRAIDMIQIGAPLPGRGSRRGGEGAAHLRAAIDSKRGSSTASPSPTDSSSATTSSTALSGLARQRGRAPLPGREVRK